MNESIKIELPLTALALLIGSQIDTGKAIGSLQAEKAANQNKKRP